MDNKAKRQTARSQLATAVIIAFISIIKYQTKGHLNYINIAVAVIGGVLFIVAFRTLYLLKKQERAATGSQKSNSEQLN